MSLARIILVDDHTLFRKGLAELLERVAGPGRGLELVTNVNGIPKGSRLAVSTNLLAAIVSVCMRATRQASSLFGPLEEHERRLNMLCFPYCVPTKLPMRSRPLVSIDKAEDVDSDASSTSSSSTP